MSSTTSNPVVCDDDDAMNDIQMVAENSSSAHPNHRYYRKNSRTLNKVVSVGHFEDYVVVAVQETSEGLPGVADAEDVVVFAGYSADSAVG